MHRSHEAGPELVPILSAGRHRSPKQGACFMEFASYLAGERWSDHPACTHPVLAALARDVNDLTSDTARERLLPHVPRVVGLTTDDPRLSEMIAVRAAASALPVASLERQRALAVGLIAVLSSLDDPDSRDRAEDALRRAPDAARWAREFIGATGVSSRRRTVRAEAIVHTASVGIALACVDDPDERLLDVLIGAIADAEAFCRPADVAERVLQDA